jgi:hypothetical protein
MADGELESASSAGRGAAQCNVRDESERDDSGMEEQRDGPPRPLESPGIEGAKPELVANGGRLSNLSQHHRGDEGACAAEQEEQRLGGPPLRVPSHRSRPEEGRPPERKDKVREGAGLQRFF